MTTLDIILLILVISWILGFSFRIAGGLIHIILVIALIVLILRIFGVKV